MKGTRPLYTGNSKTAACVVSVEATVYMLLLLKTESIFSESFFLLKFLPLTLFTDRSYLLSGNS